MAISFCRKYLYKKTGIYCFRNKINNKRYIGSTINLYDRTTNHFSELKKNRHKNEYLQRAWNKYKEDGFEFFVLEENIDESELKQAEDYWIKQYKTLDRKYGYNLSEAFRQKLSDETRKKISDTLKRKGIKPPSQLGKRFSNRPPMSEETKEKLRGRKHSKETIEKLKARKISKYTREKMSIAASGRKLSKETKEKIRIASTGRKHSKEAKQKLSEIAKSQNRKPPAKKNPVLQINMFGEIINMFDSYRDAAVSLGKKRDRASDICAVCRGRQYTAFGFIWRDKSG